MSTLVLVHVVISLIAIAAGLIVMFKMLSSDRVSGLTGIFLLFTILTNVTGFFIPPFLYDKFLPSHAIGILSLVLLAIACFALYGAKLSGMTPRLALARRVTISGLVFVGAKTP